MKKNILMATCSIMILGGLNAYALTPEASLKAIKEVYVASFEEMDDNKDGLIDKEEYLKHQFERFRSNIIQANSFEAPLNNEVVVVNENKVNAPSKSEIKDKNDNEDKVSLSTMGDSVNIMQEMANYKLDDENELDEDILPIKEDVKTDELPFLMDESVNDKDNEMPFEESVDNGEENLAEDDKDEEINKMLSVVRKTLPKQIDEITQWVDIKYKDKMVSYIYKADVDTVTFSAEEMSFLTDSIKNDACVKAYESMCPKIKPVFIDEGVSLSILYMDKSDREISSCEFNQETCK